MDQGEVTELNYCYNCMRRLEEGQTVCPDCGDDNSHIQNPENALPEGTILSGKYLVGRKLGQGGFGITYLGFDLSLQVRVAIKEYFPTNVGMRVQNSFLVTASDPDGFRKGCDEFQAEAQTLARFNSPNIVHVRDYFHENGTAYIVMDYVEGNSLTQEVSESGGRIPWERVLSLFKPLILELDKLHKKHLIHRDIKPDNLKITTDEYGAEHMVLLDFGSARSFVSSQVTKTYTAMVTPGYAPLEQYSPKSRQGPYTDIYALCATMYAAIMGETPVIATDRVIGEGELVPFRQKGISVPETVEKAIFHGMDVLGSDRPQSMGELYDELTGVSAVPDRQAEEKSIPQPPLVNDKEGSAPPEKEPGPTAKNDKTDKPKGTVSPERKKNIWYIPLLIVLLAAGFFLYRGMRQNHPDAALTQTAVFPQELQRTQTKETRAAKDAEATRTAQERLTDQGLTVQGTATQDALFAAETAASRNATKQAELRITETAAAVSAENTQTVQAGRMEQTVQAETQWAQQTQSVKDADRTATAWFDARDMEQRQTQTQSADNIQNTLTVLMHETEQAVQTAEASEQTLQAQIQQTETQVYADRRSTQQALEQQTAQAARTAESLERTRDAQAEQTASAWERTQAVLGLVQTDIARTQKAVISAEQTRDARDKTVEAAAAPANTPVPTDDSRPTSAVTPLSTPVPTATADPAILTFMGEAAYLDGDYEKALEYLIPAAHQGYASAQTYLGYLYEMGYGVTQSCEKAIEWYQKAADQGLAIAQFDLGNMYAEGLGAARSYEKAVYWYQKAADQGLAIAQNSLGNMYEYGHGAVQSYEKAAELYQKAADQRLAAAQSNLGYLYDKGLGVTRSVEKAMYWYQKAAEQGDESAKIMAAVTGIRMMTDLSAADTADVAADTPMRTDPSSFGAVMKSLQGGEKVTLTGGKNGTWIQVRTEDGQQGWIPDSAVLPHPNVPVEKMYITFGQYEQDNDLNNGPEDIEWQVLTVEDDHALVVSRYGLDMKPYHDESCENVLREIGTLRNWLNGEFYDTVFSNAEKSRIVDVTDENPDNAGFGTGKEYSTADKIFLLSTNDAEKYFVSNTERKCTATAYAESKGKDTEHNNGIFAWWLRTHGKDSGLTVFVDSTGEIIYTGKSADEKAVVRPAFWLDLQ